jgi:hypothetical protein
MNTAFGRMQVRKLCCGIAALAALWAGTSSGVIYVEVPDAGESLATAQNVNTQPGGTALDAIEGVLTGGADLFKIILTGGGTFSATTTASSLAFNNFDMQLFLFNSAGIGVYANDDDPTFGPQSTLPSGIGFTPAASGIYYLAISGTGYLPRSAGGSIFPTAGGFLDQSGGTQGAVGPTGPGGGSALSGWSSVSSEIGDYEIRLTGAQFLPNQAPEPSTILLVWIGAAGLLRRRKNRQD